VAFIDQSQPADHQAFDMVDASQSLLVRALSDAGAVQATPLTLDRAGNAGVGTSLYVNVNVYANAFVELGRPQALGYWTDVPFNASDFTANTPPDTWTVTAGQVRFFHYTVIGKTMIVSFSIVNATLNAPNSPQLLIKIPGGFQAFQTVGYGDLSVGHVYAPYNGTFDIIPVPSTNTLSLQRVDQSGWGVGNLIVRAQCTFEIQ
jgi:hypothetical protein